jgi:mRNA-degrading endonuclease RelE of RelBE toxin-antitoxin system
MIPQIIRRFAAVNDNRFKKEYGNLAPEIQKKADKAFKLMEENFNHPSLKVKIHDKERRIWEARIDREHRFTFQLDGDTVYVRRIGDHSIYDNP